MGRRSARRLVVYEQARRTAPYHSPFVRHGRRGSPRARAHAGRRSSGAFARALAVEGGVHASRVAVDAARSHGHGSARFGSYCSHELAGVSLSFCLRDSCASGTPPDGAVKSTSGDEALASARSISSISRHTSKCPSFNLARRSNAAAMRGRFAAIASNECNSMFVMPSRLPSRSVASRPDSRPWKVSAAGSW